MKLIVGGTVGTVLDDSTVEKVLNIYPEEELAKHKVFAAAFAKGEIRYQELRKQCDSIGIPWQLFLLSPKNADAELAFVEKQREHKVSKRFLAKRPGSGTITSRRILDRLIRGQTYLSSSSPGASANAFCGSLKGRNVTSAASHIFKYFEIGPATLRRKNKAATLAYLCERFESGGINVCQGVLTNGMLPYLAGSRNVYRNTSGFIIRDDCYPFAFIPSEINPDEREGRQILTLVFLIALIGLGSYEYSIEKDFKVSMLQATGKKAVAYNIASQFLLPFSDTEPLRGSKITVGIRDKLAQDYKITPSAVVTILRKRGIIDSTKYNELMPPPQKGGSRPVARTPKIETSVRKFNGRYVVEAVNRELSAGKLSPIQAQYLLFGGVKKKAFRDYKRSL